MSKTQPVDLGNLMRRIAAKYAKLDSLDRSRKPVDKRFAERKKLKEQIAQLNEQMMAR